MPTDEVWGFLAPGHGISCSAWGEALPVHGTGRSTGYRPRTRRGRRDPLRVSAGLPLPGMDAGASGLRVAGAGRLGAGCPGVLVAADHGGSAFFRLGWEVGRDHRLCVLPGGSPSAAGHVVVGGGGRRPRTGRVRVGGVVRAGPRRIGHGTPSAGDAAAPGTTRHPWRAPHPRRGVRFPTCCECLTLRTQVIATTGDGRHSLRDHRIRRGGSCGASMCRRHDGRCGGTAPGRGGRPDRQDVALPRGSAMVAAAGGCGPVVLLVRAARCVYYCHRRSGVGRRVGGGWFGPGFPPRLPGVGCREAVGGGGWWLSMVEVFGLSRNGCH